MSSYKQRIISVGPTDFGGRRRRSSASTNSLLKSGVSFDANNNQTKGLVFLSGDEHIGSVTKARVTRLDTGTSCTLHSVRSSGLFSPYPFANGSPDDFIANDRFEFKIRGGGVNPGITGRYLFKTVHFITLGLEPTTIGLGASLTPKNS